MKNGLFFENNELIYYENDHPKHAGAIKVDGAIYYISSQGRAVKGRHIVHREMTNGILSRGTYTFGDDYKLVKGSYVAAKKRKNRNKSKSKKNKHVVGALAAGLVFLCAVLGFVFFENQYPAAQLASATESDTASVQTASRIVLPRFEEDVLLCSSAAKQYYDHELALKDISVGDPYRSFIFKYSMDGTDGSLLLSENADMTDAMEFKLSADSTMLTIDNLKTGTTYHAKVIADGKDYTGSFKTARSPRFVTIPGAVNTRDIGGYETLDGKIVKQGLLIRGTEIDGLVVPGYLVPKDELSNVQDHFGFVYDLDLREPSIYSGAYKSYLGSDVGHKFYGSPQYGQVFNTVYQPALKQIFSDLADPEKYPMYLHCSWGKDRTGTIVYLLQGLLNVSEEDMMREYRLSGFVHSDIITSNGIDALLVGLEAYEGNSLQEKIVNFLTTTVGITKAEIASIQSIFLDDHNQIDKA